MDVTYLGHSSFIIKFGGKSLVFDPFITDPNIDIDNIKADYVLLSHGHVDHIREAEQILKNNSDCTLIANYEVASHFAEKKYKVHHLNHGGKYAFDFGTVKYVNAIHSSSFGDGSYAGNPGGFVIWDDNFCFYFSGDTALTMDMKLIPMTCPKLSFSIFPLGDNFTMGYEDAVLAAQFVECDKIIGCHYDTFDIIKMDAFKAKEAFKNKNLQLLLPAVGETLSI